MRVIARDIIATWPKVNYAARPYLEAMQQRTDHTPTRYAIADGVAPVSVAPYLPWNFEAVDACPDGCCTLIQGRDRDGWTLDGYVIPRLASGLITARELTLT